jgi:hypothetical protein
MKKLLILITVVGIFGLTSCYKTDPSNPYSDVDNFAIGSYLTLVEELNLQVNSSDLANAFVGITVDQYGSPVKEIKLYISDGNASDPANWRPIKTVPFTGTGTEVSCTGPDMAAALGFDPKPGVSYTMINQIITEDGRTFDLSNTSGEFESQSSYNMAMRWSVAVVCSFDAALSAGDYQILVDTWQDYSPGDVVEDAIVAGPGSNQLTMNVYPQPAYGSPINPIIIDVDPATGNATVAKVEYADYGTGTNFSAEGSGIVFSCTGFISLSLVHSAGSTTYGTYKLEIQKTE